jgi:hypothetical protein
LVERLNGIEEVTGSNPVGSTIPKMLRTIFCGAHSACGFSKVFPGVFEGNGSSRKRHDSQKALRHLEEITNGVSVKGPEILRAEKLKRKFRKTKQRLARTKRRPNKSRVSFVMLRGKCQRVSASINYQDREL